MIPHEFYVYVHCVTETKTETIFIPNVKLYKNTATKNTFCITMSSAMALISYDLISFHHRHACALFIQCLYIQQWPTTIAQLFPFVPERIRKCKRHIFGITNVTPWPYHNFPNFIQHK